MPAPFRFAALLEGSSLLFLLFVAVPLKHLAGLGEVSRLAGLVHGVCFLVYAGAVVDDLLAADREKWWAVKALAVALLPFGTFWLLRQRRPG